MRTYPATTRMYKDTPAGKLDVYLRDKFNGQATFDQMNNIDAKIFYGSLRRELSRMWFKWLLVNWPVRSPLPELKELTEDVYKNWDIRGIQHGSLASILQMPRWNQVIAGIHDTALLLACSSLEFISYMDSDVFKASASNFEKRIFQALTSLSDSREQYKSFIQPVFIMESGFGALLVRMCNEYEKDAGKPLDPNAFHAILRGMHDYTLNLASRRNYELLLSDNYYFYGEIPARGKKPFRFIYTQDGLQSVEFRIPSYNENRASLRNLTRQAKKLLIRQVQDADAAPTAIGCPALRATVPSHGNFVSFCFTRLGEAAHKALFGDGEFNIFPWRSARKAAPGKCPYAHPGPA